jgi:FkbM family methyltransferase
MQRQYDVCSFASTDVWLDMGAQIGTFSVTYAPQVKQIIAYEPEPGSYALLCRNLKTNHCTNVVAINKAIAAKQENRTFYVCKENVGAHSLVRQKGRKRITVACDNAKEVMLRHNVNKIKMDIEGAEVEVLPSLIWGAIDEIILEWHFEVIQDEAKYITFKRFLLGRYMHVSSSRHPDFEGLGLLHAKDRILVARSEPLQW